VNLQLFSDTSALAPLILKSPKLRRLEAEALGQSMVDRWLENGSRPLGGLISRNVPANEFSPRTIRNRRRFRPLYVPASMISKSGYRFSEKIMLK
jgi:hypothetical protein